MHVRHTKKHSSNHKSDHDKPLNISHVLIINILNKHRQSYVASRPSLNILEIWLKREKFMRQNKVDV